FKTMKKLKPIYKNIFNKFDLICAREISDYEKIKEFTKKVVYSGNIKYDYNFVKKEKKDFGVKEEEFVVVFGSFHIEELPIVKIVIEALKHQIPDLKVIVIPRRIEHSQRFSKALGAAIYSKNGLTDVTVVDLYGKLPEFYSICDIAIIGGSFFPHGGQNPLEATYFGKPVLFGKYMDNFKEVAENIIKEKAGFMTKGADTLTSKILELYSNESIRIKVSENATGINKKYSGATNRCIDEIIKHI
ncbi:MAG: glycosyltransferase, partial [Candidatus Aenigmarchaeota archaeon]|nr:glycosyltransferase [Candidatus Aenigmarchaeota archaeon]MDW8149075.1 glycosyltransferase [Candidatus Aenigmarchaeota archaeon]